MLGKLLKHEMKATARLLLPIYLILAVLTILDRIVIYLDIFDGVLVVIPGLITFAYVVSLIAVVGVSAVMIIYRFYKNLMTDEGYLMFTLPVKSHELINSKLIVSTFWMVASFVSVIISILIVFSGSFHLTEVREGFNLVIAEIKAGFGSDTSLFLIEFIAMLIIGVLNKILLIYVSIAIGQLFNGHKVIGSVAAFIGINIALEVVTIIGTVLAALIFRISFDEISSLPQIIFPVILAFLMVLNALFYWVTDFIFKRRINLE